jgi:hypothetical protein
VLLFTQTGSFAAIAVVGVLNQTALTEMATTVKASRKANLNLTDIAREV